MKKTLLAAALMVGFAGVAQAETSVTLYGIVDAGIGWHQVKGSDLIGSNGLVTTAGAGDIKATRTGLVSGVNSGNRWGLKGTEDLGNGLKAIFQLESGFESTTGESAQSGRLFGRQATIGLAGDSWGRFDLGRQTNIASKYFADVASPFGASFGQANAGATFGAANTVRYDNMAMYQTPNFSGFQFGVGYSFRTSGDQAYKFSGQDDTNDRAVTTGLRYANGPIGVALTYDRVKTGDNAALAGDQSISVSSWNIGASYDFEVAKIHLGFGQTRNGWLSGTNYAVAVPAMNTWTKADGLKVNSYTVGVSAPVGPGKIMASWGMADPRSNPDAFVTGAADLDKQQIYSLGYSYSLSKRTNLYALGSYAKHLAFQPDLKSTLVSVGIRHQF